MARNSIPEFSSTPSSNTDIGGVGLTDNDSAGNLRDVVQQMAAILKRTNDGETPLDDAFVLRNADDTSKTVRISAENISAGTERVLDAEALNRNGAAILTEYSTAGEFTHEFAESSRYFQVKGCGGGAAGGSTNGGSDFACAPGGASGHFGESPITEIGVLTEGTVTVGEGGTPYPTAADGEASLWSDGTNTFRFRGGVTDTTPLTASATVIEARPPLQSALHASLQFSTYHDGEKGGTGVAGMYSGNGGSTLFGPGGRGVVRASVGETAGNAGVGNGSGGSGSVRRNVGSVGNTQGGTGAPGIIIVLEW